MIDWYRSPLFGDKTFRVFNAPLIFTGAIIVACVCFALYVRSWFPLFLSLGSIRIIGPAFRDLRSIRNRVPIAIGLDDERIYFDTSLFKYGRNVESILVEGIYGLTFTSYEVNLSFKDRVRRANKEWYGGDGSEVVIEYQDRMNEVQFGAFAIHVDTENIVGLVRRLADLPNKTFKMGEQTISKEEFLKDFNEIYLEEFPLSRR